MAGRPKTKAKRVLELLEQAGGLISQFRSIKPKRKDTACPNDPLGRSWNDCETALHRAIRLNVPDTLTFGGGFSPSESLHFARPANDLA